MGDVYRARDTCVDRAVAIKTVLGRSAIGSTAKRASILRRGEYASSRTLRTGGGGMEDG